MKKLFTYAGAFLMAAALVFSCKTPESEMVPSVLKLTPETAQLSPFQKSIDFSLQCDLKWTATLEDTSWGELIVQNRREGIGGALLFKTDTNLGEEDRTNVLIIKAGKSEIRREITQKGLGNFFSPRAAELSGLEPVTISFTAPLPWKASLPEGSEWLSLSATSGAKGEASVDVSAKNLHYEDEARTGSVIFTFGTSQVTLAVSQVPSEKDPVMMVTTPGLYGIGGHSYTFGADGWNHASFITEADGSVRWRLVNAGTLSVLTLTGPKADAQQGENLILHVSLNEKGTRSLIENYSATMLYEKDGVLWYKVNEDTYFIIRKEAAL
ncbi:MAG: BACON domain-containing protein [Bacteroidales bacterium]|nr:BACON domain-containing protein [Bacteroidales bacterium]